MRTSLQTRTRNPSLNEPNTFHERPLAPKSLVITYFLIDPIHGNYHSKRRTYWNFHLRPRPWRFRMWSNGIGHARRVQGSQEASSQVMLEENGNIGIRKRVDEYLLAAPTRYGAFHICAWISLAQIGRAAAATRLQSSGDSGKLQLAH